MHRTLLRCFPAVVGPARREHGLLYRLESSAGHLPRVFVQSRITPDWALLPSGYLAANTASLNPATTSLSSLVTEIMPYKQYRFRLVANPTRDICVPQPDGTKREMRVELHGEQAWLKWLERKASLHGFRPLNHDAAYVTPNVSISPSGKLHGRREGKLLTVAPVRFDGRLEVLDVDSFRDALCTGIGRGRAYGCGLLSLAPV